LSGVCIAGWTAKSQAPDDGYINARSINRFVTPIVFIIKLDWGIDTCLTQLYYGIDT